MLDNSVKTQREAVRGGLSARGRGRGRGLVCGQRDVSEPRP